MGMVRLAQQLNNDKVKHIEVLTRFPLALYYLFVSLSAMIAQRSKF